MSRRVDRAAVAARLRRECLRGCGSPPPLPLALYLDFTGQPLAGDMAHWARRRQRCRGVVA